jgi:hypothetical protein
MTPEQIAEIAAGNVRALERALAVAVAQEREACAQIAESYIATGIVGVDTGMIWRNGMARTIAAAIRAQRVPE